jgi:hypothetical protein
VRTCANKVVAGARSGTFLHNIRPQDRRRFVSAQQIDQLEGLALARASGFKSPLPHHPSLACNCERASGGKPTSSFPNKRRVSTVACNAKVDLSAPIELRLASQLAFAHKCMRRLPTDSKDLKAEIPNNTGPQCEFSRISSIFYFGESQRNVHAGELEMRPPPAPTTQSAYVTRTGGGR